MAIFNSYVKLPEGNRHNPWIFSIYLAILKGFSKVMVDPIHRHHVRKRPLFMVTSDDCPF